MRKNILLRTYVFVCTIIIIGFILTSVISYCSNKGIFRQDVERVSALTSEGIFYKIDSIFTKPLNVSLTMANDHLLKEFLEEEEDRLEDDSYIRNMKNYLLAYKEKYSYESVFLVSANTNRYYHFKGLDRVLTSENPENEWYASFMQSEEEYSVNIDNDEAADNEITVFINCKIKEDNHIMGVVGVGFRVDSLQELLLDYENEFGVKAYLIEPSGKITISASQTGYQEKNLFDESEFSDLKEEIQLKKNEKGLFWYSTQMRTGYLVTQYIPNLEWFLIIDNDVSALEKKLSVQFLGGILILILVILAVLYLITNIIRKYHKQIVALTLSQEKAHRTVFQEETEKLYENINELDITHNCTASEATEVYFMSLGVPRNTPYDKALPIIAQNQIKKEFRQGYIETFSPSNVLESYRNGTDSLCYDFMITSDTEHYYWVRITARIFYWDSDESIRMFTYRQNIDAQKKQERMMLEKMQMDSLSGLYNKASTQQQISKILLQDTSHLYAFFILDIDRFKLVNDTFGHAMGDKVISDFSAKLKNQFRSDDLVGRIGGDEFVVFVPAPSHEWVISKAQKLVSELAFEFNSQFEEGRVTTSIGIALSPDFGKDFETLYKNADIALYLTKKKGRNGFTLYDGK